MIEEKKESLEVLNESEMEGDKKKLVLLIEPNLYRDLITLMKSCKGSVDVEDQYGELAKGKPGEDDPNSQKEFMKLLEDYEKFHLNKEDKEEKKEKVKPKPTKDKNITCTSCKSAVFDNPKDHREHAKSGWHIENLKRKIEVS